MNKTQLFAAKATKDGLWECAPQHLQDTVNVMKYLCDSQSGWISPAFINATGIEAPVFEKICIFLAAVHDIGKLTPIFQKKISKTIPALLARLEAHGYRIEITAGGEDWYHAYVSGAILNQIYRVDNSICEVVAAHHGFPRESGRAFSWDNPFRFHKENILGNTNEFTALWDETIEIAEKVSGIKCMDIPEVTPAAQILLSGILIIADWISSNEYFFPLVPLWDVSALTDTERGERGYKESGIRRGWFPTDCTYQNSRFFERFGFDANDLQKKAGGAAEAGAKLMIIEAPMAGGKTEAALMSAEIMAANNESGGLFIGLPTQATANGLYKRIADWAAKASENLAATINLAHGGARFNEDFKKLQVNTSDETTEGLSVNRWMSSRHRKLMSDFVDGTIDQAIAMSLNRKFFMLLHAQLAGKVIIFDEVHSYDAYTSAYMETTLAYLGVYRCPVILLSATLTNEKKTSFIRAYSQREDLEIGKKESYPCLSWWDGLNLHEEELPVSNAKRMDVNVQWIQSQDLTSKLKELLANGGCAGIIRNTVKEAVRTYISLKNSLEDYQVILIHSRFLMDERNKLENKVIFHTGKNSTSHDRDKIIVVGTQVLEQSLDLDFDALFTDPCPMDLLLQRLGREHRHDRIRPEGLEHAILYLLRDDEKIIGSDGRPYDSYIIHRTCELLSTLKRDIQLPTDIKPLIEKTYDLTDTDDDSEKRKYIESIRRLENDSEVMRIRDPRQIRSIRGLAQEIEASEVDENSGVRQGDGSRSVILLKIKNGFIMDTAETVSCEVGSCPDEHTGEVFLRQIILIPSYAISEQELIQMKASSGLGSYKIWEHKDILLVDEKCSYEHKIGRRTKRYIYRSEMGLMEAENE